MLSFLLLAASSCAAPEYRALDFFLGTWQVSNAQGQLMGHSRYTLRAGGCALFEEWYGSRGGRAIALVYYDSTRKEWLRQNIAAGFREFDSWLAPGGRLQSAARGCVLIETDPVTDAVTLLFYDPEIKAWRRRTSPR